MVITALLSLLLGFVLTAAIIAANGYFVAQEFAYMSVDRATLRTGAEKGDASAERALKVTKRTSFMLSGAQLGITVTGLMVGYVAEPFIGESLGELLSSAGVPIAVGISIGTVAALVLATVVQMIFGELYPKNLAIANPRSAVPTPRPVDADLPGRVRLADHLLRQVLQRDAASAARRTGARRGQQCHRQGSREHHRRFPGQRRSHRGSVVAARPHPGLSGTRRRARHDPA